MTMTVDEAVETLAKHFTLDTPELDAIFTLRRYVEEVREVERLAKINQIPAAVDYGQRLAAAREGRSDD